jgi:hypothetical protein
VCFASRDRGTNRVTVDRRVVYEPRRHAALVIEKRCQEVRPASLEDRFATGRGAQRVAGPASAA